MGGSNGDRLEINELLRLKRWNMPTIYNGWEQITNHDITRHFNKEAVTDFMSYMGPMIGYAVTLQFEPSDKDHKRNETTWKEHREYVAGISGPKIVVLQDLGKPETYGSFWGEVSSNVHRALECVGTITDGAVRDVDEMMNAGLKVIARRMCVGHAHSISARRDCGVEVFGCPVLPGQLIHADKHGFLAISREDERRLLEATRFTDDNECSYVISAGRDTVGKAKEEILENMLEAGGRSQQEIGGRYGRKGEMH